MKATWLACGTSSPFSLLQFNIMLMVPFQYPVIHGDPCRATRIHDVSYIWIVDINPNDQVSAHHTPVTPCPPTVTPRQPPSSPVLPPSSPIFSPTSPIFLPSSLFRGHSFFPAPDPHVPGLTHASLVWWSHHAFLPHVPASSHASRPTMMPSHPRHTSSLTSTLPRSPPHVPAPSYAWYVPLALYVLPATLTYHPHSMAPALYVLLALYCMCCRHHPSSRPLGQSSEDMQQTPLSLTIDEV